MKRAFRSPQTNPSDKSSKRYISPLADVTPTSGSTPSQKKLSGSQQTFISSSSSVFGIGSAVFGQNKTFGIHSSKETAVQDTSGRSVSPLLSTSSTKANGTKTESGMFGGPNFGQPFGASVKETSGEINSNFSFSSQSAFGATKTNSFTTPVFGRAPGTTALIGSSQLGPGTESKSLQAAFGITTNTSTTVAGSNSQRSFVNTMKPVAFTPLITVDSPNTAALGEIKEKSSFSSGLQGSQLSSIAGSMPLKFGFDAASSSDHFSSVGGTSVHKDSGGGVSVTKDVFGSVASSSGSKVAFSTLSEHKPAAKINVRVFDAKPVSSDTKLESTGNKDFGITANITGGKSVFGQTNKISDRLSHEEKGFKIDISKNTSLVIREIPDVFNKNQWLKRFYSRFGEVVKVMCYPNKKSATISFKKHVSTFNWFYWNLMLIIYDDYI